MGADVITTTRGRTPEATRPTTRGRSLTVALVVLGAAPLLACGVGGYALYNYAQVVIGQEYLRLPGNVERFFPLLLLVFLLAEGTVVLAWRALPASLSLPPTIVSAVSPIVLQLTSRLSPKYPRWAAATTP